MKSKKQPIKKSKKQPIKKSKKPIAKVAPVQEKKKRVYDTIPKGNPELAGRPINSRISKCDVCREGSLGCLGKPNCQDFWPEAPGMSSNFSADPLTINY